MEQELNNSSESVQAESQVQSENKTADEVKPEVTEQHTEEYNTDAKDAEKSQQSPDEKVENYQRRKSKEFDELKRQLEEKDRQLNEFINNPPKDGEVFDPLLGITISENLPASEYRNLLQQRMEKEQEVKAISHLKKQVDAVNAKYDDAEAIMRNATKLGLINDHIIVAAGNSKDGKGMEFLYKLAKEAPNELEEIASIQNPYMQAVAFGERLSSFKAKPAARTSVSDTPPNNISEVGRFEGGDISGLSKEAQYRAKLAAYRQQNKF